MKYKFVHPLESVWDTKRRIAEREYIDEIQCHKNSEPLDYITNNPHIKKIIKEKLEKLYAKGYSLLKIADYVGYDLKVLIAWLNANTANRKYSCNHGAIITLLKICGYELKVTITSKEADEEYLKQFIKDKHDMSAWEERNAKYLH